MVRMITGLVLLSICLWCSISIAQQASQRQQSELLVDSIPAADFGLAGEVRSAIDLVGPEQGLAGRNRDALVVRVRCWIDGDETCLVGDKNDPRIQKVRQFLARGPMDRRGWFTIEFPDQSKVDVGLERSSNPRSTDWGRRVYDPVVLAVTVRAPELPLVPTRSEQFVGLDYDGAPLVQAALRRLKGRLVGSGDGSATEAESSDRGPALAKEQSHDVQDSPDP